MNLTPRIDLIDKNFLINSHMGHWQRGNSFNITGNNSSYQADRFKIETSAFAGTVNYTISRSTDVPTISESNYFFNYSYQFTVNTPEATTPSTASCFMTQLLELPLVSELFTQNMKTSFWVKSSIAGDYTLHLFLTGGAPYQFYKTRVTIDSPNTWEKKVISIPKMSILTSIPTSNFIQYAFQFANGSGNTGDLNNDTWTDNFASQWAVSNHVNLTETSGATINLTGFKLAIDNGDSTDQEFNLFNNSYEGDFIACQRYFEKSYLQSVAPGTISDTGKKGFNVATNTTTAFAFDLFFMTQKRAIPVVTTYSPVTGASGNGDRNGTDTTAIPFSTTEHGCLISDTGTNVSSSYWCHYTADAEL